MSHINPQITVVIPVYNVELYLEQCVLSVLGQSYTNLEIILVDDGSKDSCADMCDNFAAIDARVKVIHKTNGGLSDARNAAIDVAQGEYIVFVDGDDFILEDTIFLLYNSLSESNSDISTCGFGNYYGGTPVGQNRASNQSLVLDSERALADMLYQKHTTTSAWGKLYKTKLFEEVRYPKGEICEDLDTTYRLFSKSSKIVMNTSRCYQYRQRADSIIRSNFSSKRMKAIEFAQNMAAYVQSNHPKIIKSAENRLFMEALFIAVQIPRANDAYSRELLICKGIIYSCRRTVLFDARSKFSYRIYAALSMLSISVLILVYSDKARVAALLHGGEYD
jgi:glycosyltransferase involved in cell wall biosynthesis